MKIQKQNYFKKYAVKGLQLYKEEVCHRKVIPQLSGGLVAPEIAKLH